MENDNEVTFYNPQQDPTEGVYKGFDMIQAFQMQLEKDSRTLDPAIDNLLELRFNPRNIRKMSDETAIEAIKILEVAKQARTRTYLEFTSRLLSEDFYRKQLELERQKFIQGVKSEADPEVILPRKNEKKILRLLQDAVQKRLDDDREG